MRRERRLRQRWYRDPLRERGGASGPRFAIMDAIAEGFLPHRNDSQGQSGDGA